MNSREDFSAILHEILGSDNVYFQPPESIKLKYPCIIYRKSTVLKANANNRAYKLDNGYGVTVIDKNPDSQIHLELMKRFPMSALNSFFQSDNLNHFNLTIFY